MTITSSCYPRPALLCWRLSLLKAERRVCISSRSGRMTSLHRKVKSNLQIIIFLTLIKLKMQYLFANISRDTTMLIRGVLALSLSFSSLSPLCHGYLQRSGLQRLPSLFRGNATAGSTSSDSVLQAVALHPVCCGDGWPGLSS